MGLYSSFRRKPESICALGSGLRRNDGQNTLPIYQIGKQLSDCFSIVMVGQAHLEPTLGKCR